MAEPLAERTPMVTVEIQLRPPVPLEAAPWWHGYHQLTFRESGRVVWEGTVDCAELAPAHVEPRPGFGWVLVLNFTHDQARAILAAKGPVIPEFITAVVQG